MSRIYTTTNKQTGHLTLSFRLGNHVERVTYSGRHKHAAKAEFKRHLLSIAPRHNKILCFEDCQLIFDEVRGWHIYKAVHQMAEEYGYGETWDDESEDTTMLCDDAMDWLNENVCINCRLEWNDGSVWLMRDGFYFAEN